MGMFDIFTQGKPENAPVTTPAPAAPGTPPATNLANTPPGVEPVQTPGTAPNGVVPDNVPETPASPLDQWQDIWQTDPNAAPPAGNFVPEKLDAPKLQEVMSKVDLKTAVTPENLAAIQAGGEGATEALMNSMNSIAQSTLVQSALVTNKMVEQAVQKTQEAMMKQIPDLIKKQGLTNALNETNKIYSNPAVAPVIDAVKSQLATKFPEATTQELTQKAQDFVTAMGAAVTPAAPAPAANPNETNWADFLGEEQP